MGTAFQFGFLWWLTGSPFVALLVLLVLGGVADWYSLGLVRRFVRLAANLRRGTRLTRELAQNPANRKVRFDLGEVLVERGRNDRAIDFLKPLLEEDPGDLQALFVMGRACLNAGRVEQGELFLGAVESADPGFRHGAVPLALGRARLERGDAAGALEPFRRYLGAHPTSVEGHCLLASALSRSGDKVGAELERVRAWNEYTTSLPFQRRAERLWAWRARPSRPLIWAVVLVASLAGASMLWQRAQLGRASAEAAQRYGLDVE